MITLKLLFLTKKEGPIGSRNQLFLEDFETWPIKVMDI